MRRYGMTECGSLFDFLDQVGNEVAILIIQESHLDGNVENDVAHSGRIVRIIDYPHRVFLGGNYKFTFAWQVFKFREDEIKVLAGEIMVVIVVNDTHLGVERTQITHQWTCVGNARHTQNSVGSSQPPQRRQLRTRHGEHRHWVSI